MRIPEADHPEAIGTTAPLSNFWRRAIFGQRSHAAYLVIAPMPDSTVAMGPESFFASAWHVGAQVRWAPLVFT